jgi:hypothetical protein
MLMEHVDGIRQNVTWTRSRITIFVEHNLGFEVMKHPRPENKKLEGVMSEIYSVPSLCS